MKFFWKIKKRLCKSLAKVFPMNSIRCRLWKTAGLAIGKDVYIGEDLIVIDELEDKDLISIGDRVAFAERVTLVVSSYPNNSRITPYINKIHGKITIKEDAWLGTGSIILPNVTVGKGAVVGAGSVVSRDVPDLTIVVGIPARPIRKLDIAI
ncbi:MAG: acyltransferase [Melioribacteraceae bacterium]|nr:acyltransferase [Melioribacteraceae bacterium]